MIRTSVESETLDTASTVKTYKSLSGVEQAFRSYKTIDLKVRPIYHHLENRVRAHVFLCLLAYYVEWHMKRALASLLFMDEDWELKNKDKTDVVSPAKRSKKALTKVRRKKTENNLTVHSFSTLMADLGTITFNTIHSKLDGNLISFEKITQPTVLQQKALDLLGVSLLCTQ